MENILENYFNMVGNIEIIVDDDLEYGEERMEIGPLQGVLSCVKMINSKYIMVNPSDTPFISTKHYLALRDILINKETGMSSFINEKGKITSINFVLINNPEKFDDVKKLIQFKLGKNLRIRMTDIFLCHNLFFIRYNSQLHGSFVNINDETDMENANKFIIDDFEFGNHYQIILELSYLNFLQNVLSNPSNDIISNYIKQFKVTMIENQVRNDVNTLIS